MIVQAKNEHSPQRHNEADLPDKKWVPFQSDSCLPVPPKCMNKGAPGTYLHPKANVHFLLDAAGASHGS